MMDKLTYDLCIIGGGINGCGIARDAAGRGYKVLLLEKGDFAQGTSAASTKLIHGGLRYLEHFEFGLVRKALKEREVLLNIAPHIVSPMRFIMPHEPHLRPLWLMRLGVFLYDHIGSRISLEKSCKTKVNNKILNQKIKYGLAYSDCWVDDARLVVLNAMDAAVHGADMHRDEKVIGVKRHDDVWSVETDKGQYHAQMVINAAGPWASQIIDGVAGVENRPLRLVKGSHIIVSKLYAGNEAYVLQHDDKRIVFVIPYEGDYSLIGTTDVDMGHNPDQDIVITNNEINYLIDIVNAYFQRNIRTTDIVSTYSGVRPLMDDAAGDVSKASRDYKIDTQTVDGMPFFSILGGKLTTYRVLAEEVTNLIDRQFNKDPKPWTFMHKLPGGDIPDNDMKRYVREQAATYPFLSQSLIRRYAQHYGTCMNIILNGVTSLDDMGRDLGGGVYGRELDYLRVYEYARTATDVLWRRSKLGLHLDSETVSNIDAYMREHAA